jgi:glutamate racemase
MRQTVPAGHLVIRISSDVGRSRCRLGAGRSSLASVHDLTSADFEALPRRDAPVGIFDSGFGGLTVARSVIDQLPHESIVYVGDTARQPYGPKPIGEVREYALECLDHLVALGAPPCSATPGSATTSRSSR